MTSTPALSVPLSQALVAFTIEFDNEAEHRLPHRTTDHGASADGPKGPWLVSMPMWFNCMRHVPEAGITARDLLRAARTPTNFDGMRRWGYVVFDPKPAGASKQPRPDALVRPTRGGWRAQQVWGALFGDMEARWRERFGPVAIDRLRAALWAIAGRSALDLPDCLPILKPGPGLFSQVSDRPGERADLDEAALPLPTLLSRVLLEFAVDFERGSSLSLAVAANLLRVLDETGVRLRDLPGLTGTSIPAVNMAMGALRNGGMAIIEPDPDAARGQRARLTSKGRRAQEACARRLLQIEANWRIRFGDTVVDELRAALTPLVGDGTPTSPLFAGLQPYPDGWRAKVGAPSVLPNFPMVLHRGGYPDGA
ncbi:MAG TPA: MarR family winged helix-turn-helix transcriptional regulator [Caulobacteraceae bacterium]|nr:MarR family winged helix-turn-helix transcriptional regulator [Caulobacteraceae bacterium]